MYTSTHTSLSVLNSIDQFLKEKTPLKPYDTVFLAVSGGQDSICLLFCFYQLQSEWEISLQIVWCHHLWQLDAFYTAREVAKVAFLLQVPLLAAVSCQKLITEKAAREWRHKSFQRLLSFYQTSNLLMGHTASDKIETVLFNLLKGSGSYGMLALRETKIIRNGPANQKTLNIFETFKVVYRVGSFSRNRECASNQRFDTKDAFIRLNHSNYSLLHELQQFSSRQPFKVLKIRSSSFPSSFADTGSF